MLTTGYRLQQSLWWARASKLPWSHADWLGPLPKLPYCDGLVSTVLKLPLFGMDLCHKATVPMNNVHCQSYPHRFTNSCELSAYVSMFIKCKLFKLLQWSKEWIHKMTLPGWHSQNNCHWRQHNSIMGKNYGGGYYIWYVLGMVFRESSNARLLWRKILPEYDVQCFPN